MAFHGQPLCTLHGWHHLWNSPSCGITSSTVYSAWLVPPLEQSIMWHYLIQCVLCMAGTTFGTVYHVALPHPLCTLHGWYHLWNSPSCGTTSSSVYSAWLVPPLEQSIMWHYLIQCVLCMAGSHLWNSPSCGTTSSTVYSAWLVPPLEQSIMWHYLIHCVLCMAGTTFGTVYYVALPHRLRILHC